MDSILRYKITYLYFWLDYLFLFNIIDLFRVICIFCENNSFMVITEDLMQRFRDGCCQICSFSLSEWIDRHFFYPVCSQHFRLVSMQNRIESAIDQRLVDPFGSSKDGKCDFTHILGFICLKKQGILKAHSIVSR